ncbi:MAG: xanthine dehydrogenase family protein subunit M [Bacillota bacterium]
MPSYDYLKCVDLKQAFQLLESKEQVYPFAGGTDLLNNIRNGKVKTDMLLDVKEIDEIKVLREVEEGMIIGAGISLNEVANFAPLRNNLPILAEGAHSVGSYPIRNRATLGGNICNASPAADTAPPLYCLGALVNIVSSNQSRAIPIEEFFVGPGETALKKGELVHSVLIPKPFPDGKGVYLKASRTGSVDLATVGVGVQRWGNQVKIAVGAVAPTPVRALSVEKAINENGEKDWAKAARLVHDDISPITDLRGSIDYCYHLSEVLVRRGLEQTMGV